jgi:hypothetical protein
MGNGYSISQLSEVQEPHSQPPPRKRRGGYDVPYVIRKRYIPNYSLPIFLDLMNLCRVS